MSDDVKASAAMEHVAESVAGFCTCDGDPRIDVTCGIPRHRAKARAQMVPPPNPLLAATVDDEPAVPLVGCTQKGCGRPQSEHEFGVFCP